MPKLYDIVWVRPNPADPSKPYYQNCGAVSTTKAGGKCIILNVLPVGPSFNGILQLYEPKVKEPAVETVASKGDEPDLGL